MDERHADAGRARDDPDPATDLVLETVEPEAEDELDAREAERIRRRDHDADAGHRALMRAGMGKVFKQILDRQARGATEPPEHGRRRPR